MGRKVPNITPEQAYKLWCELEKPHIKRLAEVLNEQGFEVNETTLGRWRDKSPAWVAEFAAKHAPVPPEKLIKALEQAAFDAPQLKPEHYNGVKAQLVARLYDAIKEMPFTSIEEWMRGLDCCERIEGLIHAERGKAVSEAANTLEKSARTLAQRLGAANGSVVVGPFKKPGSNGAA